MLNTIDADESIATQRCPIREQMQGKKIHFQFFISTLNPYLCGLIENYILWQTLER
jgi:hypothetical protein